MEIIDPFAGTTKTTQKREHKASAETRARTSREAAQWEDNEVKEKRRLTLHYFTHTHIYAYMHHVCKYVPCIVNQYKSHFTNRYNITRPNGVR